MCVCVCGGGGGGGDFLEKINHDISYESADNLHEMLISSEIK